MVSRTIIDPMEQMRDFDFVQGAKDQMLGLGALAQDVFSQLGATVVAGLVATQTSSASLTINIGKGSIYQFAPTDALAVGSIPADLTQIVQQGLTDGQIVTLTAPSSGQSQWYLIQAQFSQVDAIRSGDPNSGIVPFYNVANPAQPTSQSVNTVRSALCIIQVVSGSAATTGTEVPPLPNTGWVPLYLIDVTGGQTQITTSQILRAAPSIGTGVSASYPRAPFLTGLLAAHHGGVPGQAPKISLTSEVQGVLPYVNMSPVRTLLNAGLNLYVSASTGNDQNLGTTPGAPFLTVQAAIRAAFTNYDFNNFGCTINLANGAYGGSVPANGYVATIFGTPLGMSGSLQLVGNPSNPSAVVLGAINANCVGTGGGTNVLLNGMTITATGTNNTFVLNSGFGLANNGGNVTVQNCIFGTCGSFQVHAGAGGSVVVLLSGITFTGTTQCAVAADTGFIWMPGQVFNVSGLVSTLAFALASDAGTIQAVSDTWVGSATGPRYLVNQNGIILTGLAGSTYFPGSSGGTSPTGGQYL